MTFAGVGPYSIFHYQIVIVRVFSLPPNRGRKKSCLLGSSGTIVLYAEVNIIIIFGDDRQIHIDKNVNIKLYTFKYFIPIADGFIV